MDNLWKVKSNPEKVLSISNFSTVGVYNLSKTKIEIFGPFKINITSWCPIKISDNLQKPS